MKYLIIILALASTTACLKKHGLVDNIHPEIQPVELYPETPQIYAPGALFSDLNSASGLISDSRAFRVNDIVLVQISEAMSATNAANTDLERSNSNSFKVPNAFGNANFFGLTGAATDGTVLGTSTESTHEGSGTTARSDTFIGSLATRVVQVLPNGYLTIQGHKMVEVNDEKVRCYITGIVNPLMITRDHTISSNQIADLHIRYGGYGVVTAQQSPGLFARLLNMIWPF